VLGLLLCFVLMTSLLLALTACSGSSTAEPTPQVVITAWTAEVVGKLTHIDGCIRVVDQAQGIDYALVWTPDVSATIEGDQVRIITGIVRKKEREVVLQFGEMVRVSGGETTAPDEQLLNALPASCRGPYWVVGSEIAPVQATPDP
jgi:hypothetical protein